MDIKNDSDKDIIYQTEREGGPPFDPPCCLVAEQKAMKSQAPVMFSSKGHIGFVPENSRGPQRIDLTGGLYCICIFDAKKEKRLAHDTHIHHKAIVNWNGRTLDSKARHH